MQRKKLAWASSFALKKKRITCLLHYINMANLQIRPVKELENGVRIAPEEFEHHQTLEEAHKHACLTRGLDPKDYELKLVMKIDVDLVKELGVEGATQVARESYKKALESIPELTDAQRKDALKAGVTLYQ